MTHRSERGSAITLKPDTNAAVRAQSIVHDLCRRAGLPDRIVEDAALVVRELVSHSIQQAHSPMRLRVVLAADQVTLRVQDLGSVSPLSAGVQRGELRRWETVTRLSASFGFHCGGVSREMWALLRDPRVFPAPRQRVQPANRVRPVP